MQALYAQAVLVTFNICWQMFEYFVYFRLKCSFICLDFLSHFYGFKCAPGTLMGAFCAPPTCTRSDLLALLP